MMVALHLLLLSLLALLLAPPVQASDPPQQQEQQEQQVHAARYVEVGWKYFLGQAGYSGEYVAAAECARSWERTDGAVWALSGTALRLANTSLCVDNANISSAMGDSAELHLAPCSPSSASQRWTKRPSGALQSAQDGRCLAVSPGNTTILAALRMVGCDDHDPQQGMLWQADGRLLIGPRRFCVEAASAVPHRRRLLASPTSSSPLLRQQADAFFARLAPLFAHTSGPIGLVVSAGWIMDLVTEWTGEATQPYPIDNPEAPQVRETLVTLLFTIFLTV
jgi:hypothetical protein